MQGNNSLDNCERFTEESAVRQSHSFHGSGERAERISDQVEQQVLEFMNKAVIVIQTPQLNDRPTG